MREVLSNTTEPEYWMYWSLKQIHWKFQHIDEVLKTVELKLWEERERNFKLKLINILDNSEESGAFPEHSAPPPLTI